ncbi:four helix bundle protein [Flavisolibacter nicotianae]|uniref:four helix bundle protein n=1 Tax=Flavisolibacter nicotianae TaxID=2364882 RepID=UPI000EB0F111|nr:four helix bundle protein [Flavisolibacter nicotianae]
MAAFKKFEEIIAWQKARYLNKRVGGFIDSGRFKSNYRLINQIEGSAGSIMDNIAEGFERSGNKELLQFLYIAKGSCGEFRSQLYRALDRQYISQNEFDELYELARQVIVMLQKLIGYLETSVYKGSKYKNRDEGNALT